MNRRGILFLQFIIYASLLNAFASEWSYNGEKGTSHWSANYPACGKNAQSPVDIVRKNYVIDPNLRALEFPGYGKTLDGGEFANNGHTLQLNIPSNKTFSIQGGGLGGNKYRALQLHFHWAAEGSSGGSEHTIDGKHMQAEMHVVHIKEPYTSLDQVKDMDDGLAVLGVFLDAGGDNSDYKSLLKEAGSCTPQDCSLTLNDGPSLISLLPDSGAYYRYSGSLTTPPCYQTVTWIVFEEKVLISESELDILRTALPFDLTDSDEIRGNYRPTQPLNGRIVTSYQDISFKKSKESHGWTYYDPNTGTDKWPETYPICGKDAQSPIKITSKSRKKLAINSGSTVEVKPFVFSEAYNENLTGTFINNGHAVQLNFQNHEKYTIKEGGLKDSYTALQLHFHWGEIRTSDKKISGGSEHTLDEKRFAAELHIVHAKTAYLSGLSDFQKNSSDAYTVLGVFVDVDTSDETSSDVGANEDMQKLINAIYDLTFKDSSASFNDGPALSSLLPKSKSFYRYSGSLTTPPCYESVIWTVFADPIMISYNQFIAFQRLFDDESDNMVEDKSIKFTKKALKIGTGAEKTGEEADSITVHLNITENHLLRNTYRPVQDINSRNVYYYDGSTVEDAKNVGLIVGIGLLGVILLTVLFFFGYRHCIRTTKKDYTAAQREL